MKLGPASSWLIFTVISLLTTNAFAQNKTQVSITLIEPGPSLVENACTETPAFPIAKLATYLYVQRSLNASFAQSQSPIVLVNGSGLGSSPEQRYLIDRKEIGIRNVAGLTDLLGPDAYVYTKRERDLDPRTQATWTAAALNQNTPVVGTDVTCNKRTRDAVVCDRVSKALVYQRGQANIAIVTTADDETGEAVALREIFKHETSNLRVWIRHPSDAPIRLSDEAKATFDLIMTQAIVDDADRSPKVIVTGSNAAGITITLKKNADRFTIVNEQKIEAAELDPLTEPAVVLDDINTVFCEAYNTPFGHDEHATVASRWIDALTLDAEIVALPDGFQPDVPQPWTRLTNDQLTEPAALFRGEVRGRTLNQNNVRTTMRRPVDDRGRYAVVGTRSQLLTLGVDEPTPVYADDGRRVLMQDRVWDQRNKTVERAEFRLTFGAGPTYGLTRVFVPDDINPYPHRVFDGINHVGSGFEADLLLEDETTTRRLTLQAGLQFGAIDIGTPDAPDVVPTRDRFVLNAAFDYLGWSATRGNPLWLPNPRVAFRLDSQFSRQFDVAPHRFEPSLGAGPVWSLGRWFDIGGAVASKAFVFGTTEAQQFDLGIGFQLHYQLRPLPLVRLWGQPLTISSSGEYARYQMNDDFAIEFRHRHELAQRLFDIVEVYAAVDWFDFGRASVGTFAEHTQWLLGVRASFFLRHGRIERTHERH